MTKLCLKFMRGNQPLVVRSRTEFGSLKKWLKTNGVLEDVFSRQEQLSFDYWVHLGEINYRGGGVWGPYADQTLLFVIRPEKEYGLGVGFGIQTIEENEQWYGTKVIRIGEIRHDN